MLLINWISSITVLIAEFLFHSTLLPLAIIIFALVMLCIILILHSCHDNKTAV